MRLHRGLAALTVVAVLGLSACASGTDDSGSAPSAAVDSQKTTTLTAGDFSDTVSGSMEAVTSLHMEGVTSSPAGDAAMSGDISYVDGTVAMRVTTEGVEVIVMDGVTYLGMGGQFQVMTDDAFSVDALLESADLSAAVQEMADSISGFEVVGSEEIDGTTATHYQFDMTTDGVAEPVTVHYWLDEENRPIQTRTTVGDVTVVSTFSRFGEPVTITAPPADQIVDSLF